jgi:ribonucleoside-diphosphate reductase alpha chain
MQAAYADYFPGFMQKGVDNELLNPELLNYDLPRLAKALKAERDEQFDYLGLQTLYDRYFLHVRKTRIELPQAFFMRVAMGLALNEIDRKPAPSSSTSCCRPSTSCRPPHAVQQRHAALAAVVLLPDHRARRPGRHLRIHQGKRPAVQVCRRPGQRLDPCARPGLAHQGHQRRIARRGALPQGGQRHGRGREPGRQAQGRGLRLPGILAPGHRRVPGAAQEHRRRPPPHPRHEHGELDSRPVHEARDGKGQWTLFSPADAPDLHDLYGEAFEKAYTAYEAKADSGELKLFKRVPAVDLWRKMLSMLFETGHPWITFKDPATSARPSSTWAWCTRPTCAPRSRSTPATPKPRSATWAR